MITWLSLFFSEDICNFYSFIVEKNISVSLATYMIFFSLFLVFSNFIIKCLNMALFAFGLDFTDFLNLAWNIRNLIVIILPISLLYFCYALQAFWWNLMCVPTASFHRSCFLLNSLFFCFFLLFIVCSDLTSMLLVFSSAAIKLIYWLLKLS